jgi:hypothetical protein
MSRANQWFILGDGIAREVITADIQRYLGPDTLVRPGVGTGAYYGQTGYWITAYRTLTSQMLQDLKMDSQRWQQERQPRESDQGAAILGSTSAKISGPDSSLVAYQDSRTHAARQYWGPTKPYEHMHAPTTKSSPYAQSSEDSANYSQSSSASQIAGPPPSDPYRSPVLISSYNSYSDYPPYTPYSYRQPQGAPNYSIPATTGSSASSYPITNYASSQGSSYGPSSSSSGYIMSNQAYGSAQSSTTPYIQQPYGLFGYEPEPQSQSGPAHGYSSAYEMYVQAIWCVQDRI